MKSNQFYNSDPKIGIIGVPNVGKSTLINAIIGRKIAVFDDMAGVTRDITNYKTMFSNKNWTLVDSGGIDFNAIGIDEMVSLKAQSLINSVDILLFITDIRTLPSESEKKIAKMICKAGVKCILVLNKAESDTTNIGSFYSLGLGDPIVISALHKKNIYELLEKIDENLPKNNKSSENDVDLKKVVILGKPNVGKSSLLNKLSNSARSIVSDIAGTTRDPVDEYIELDGEVLHFIDTAGIKKKAKNTFGADYYSVLRTTATLEKSDIALLLIDADDDITLQDFKIFDLINKSRRAVIVLVNKWDAISSDKKRYIDEVIKNEFQKWIIRINISAKTGRGVDKIKPAIDLAYKNWTTRIPTHELNKTIKDIVDRHPHPVRGGKQPKIRFVTQPQTAPIKFLIFSSGFLEESYRRYIENSLRDKYGFLGTPILISVKIKDKRDMLYEGRTHGFNHE